MYSDDSMKKELGDKIDKIKSEVSAQEKALSRQITDNQKSLQDKLSAQEKGTKELTDKIGIKRINVATNKLRFSQTGEE